MPLVAALPAIIGAGAGLAGTILSGNNTSNAVNNAANTQANAALQGAQLQVGVQNRALDQAQNQFNTNQANFAPYLGAGTSALNQEMALLGLGSYTPGTPVTPGTAASGVGVGSPAASAATAASTTPDWVSYVQNNPDVLAAYNNFGAKQGTSLADFGQWHWNTFGQNEVAQGQRSYTPYGPGASSIPGASQPASATGTAATAGSFTPAQPGQQQAAIDALKASPLYTSLFNNGRDTLLANSAATGGLRGGNTENSLARFGSDTLASVIQNQLTNLSGVANSGLGAAQNIGSLNNGTSSNLNATSAATAANQGNLINQAGAATAGGILGTTASNNSTLSGLTNGFSSLAGNPQIQQLLGSLFGGGGSSAVYGNGAYGT